jgi:mono/diheme cytochrome c family protein
MAEIQLLGLFHEVEQVASTVEQVRNLGVKDEQVEILSHIPYHHSILGRPKPKGIVSRMALLGAGLGLITAVTLVAGTGMLYPLNQGNQPIVPIPPMLIIMFELAMLGTMWAAFFGMLVSNGFPVFKKQAYHPQISIDSIGLAVAADESLAEKIEAVFKDNQAHQMTRESASPKRDTGMLRFWGGFVVFLIIVISVGGLFVYDVVRIPFPSQMIEQESIAAQQGPRLAAPVSAVPVQGSILVNGQPSNNPVAASADSLQRGKILFSIDCELCHGATGVGNGKVSAFLDKKPADLTSAKVQALEDDDIYMVIMQGFGNMPRLAEHLNPQDGWDVINYVRTLKK